MHRRDLLRTAAGALAGATLTSFETRLAQAAPAPEIDGVWSSIISWPKVPIHANYLPDGRLLTWADADGTAYNAGGLVSPYVADIPVNGQPGNFVLAPNARTNLFCSGHTYLADGRLFITGGQVGPIHYGVADVNLFDWRVPGPYSATNSPWTTIAGFPQKYARWYGTAVLLGDGGVLVAAGLVAGTGDYNLIPQVWSPDRGTFRDLTGASLKLQLYPKLFLTPTGLVFHVGPERTSRFLDTTGTGKWTEGPRRMFAGRQNGSAAMYADGKILIAGGGSAAPSNTAEVIDLGATTPAWRLVAPMKYARKFMNATLLPDGQVLVTGGSGAPGFNDAAGAVLPAELWNPATEAWTTMASAQVPRIYHSTAILLADGRVMSMGGGRPPASNGGKNNDNVEIFSPPYLFKGKRPIISAAPGQIGYGSKFAVATPDGGTIAKVRLLKIGSVTHTCNMGQHIATLPFTKTANGLNVTVPTTRNTLPPGYYMLFILNGAGVPSIGEFVRVGAA